MKNRKILSAVVTAALLVGSVTPSTVFAESSWTSGSPAPASNGGISTQATGEVNVAAAADFGTIAADTTYKLTADVPLSSTLNISASGVTIDLNGHTLNCDFNGQAIVVTGSLTVKDSGTGGKIERTGNFGTNYVMNVKGGTVTFESGSLIDKNQANLTTVNVSGGGTLTLNGGHLESTGEACLVKIDSVSGGATKSDRSKFVMTGGTLRSTCATGTDTAVQLGVPGTNAPGGLSWAGAINNYCNVEISGGKIEGIVWANDDGDCTNPTIKISGSTEIEGIIQVGSDYRQSGTSGLKVEMTGGTLNGAIAYTQCAANASSSWIKDGNLTVSGGTLNLTAVKLPEQLNDSGSVATMTVADTVSMTLAESFPTDSVEILNTALPEDKQIGVNEDGTLATGGYAIEDKTAADANGTITIKTGNAAVTDSSTLVVKGSTVTVTAAPAAGYAAKGVTVTNTKDSSAVTVTQDADDPTVFTFAMPEGAVEVAAEFEKEYAVTVPAKTDEGEVKTDKAKAVRGTKITLTVTPGEGYELDTLTVDGTKVTVTGSTYSFDMPEKDVAVTATFKKTEIAVESVALDQTTAELKVGDTVALKATVKPDNATNKTVAWTSDTTDVATVDANGKVTAVKAGTATITATAGGKTATCKVTVTEKKVDSSVTLKAGEKKVLTTKTDAAAKTRNESAVLVIPKATAEGYAGVKVTVTGKDWTKTSGLIKTCYAKVVHTDADGVKTTVDAGSDFVIAVTVTDIPDGVDVEYSFTPANE